MKKWLVALAVAIVLAGGGIAGWYFGMRDTSTTGTTTGTSQRTKTAPVSPPPAGGSQSNTQTPQTYLVKVYFSKHPSSDNDPSLTFPVNRTTDTLGVARFAVNQLLQGPTASERAAGYFTTARLSDGINNCNGQDFTIAIANHVATLRFCRPFDHLGAVADGQAKSELEATLKQFSSVHKVILLNYKGDCEFDLSGLNLCKQ